MRMLVDWTIIELAIIAAFHPQMRNHGQIIGKAKQQILAPADQSVQSSDQSSLPKLLDVVFNRFPIVNVNSLNLTARRQYSSTPGVRSLLLASLAFDRPRFF